jgi:hypothetical protein
MPCTVQNVESRACSSLSASRTPLPYSPPILCPLLPSMPKRFSGSSIVNRLSQLFIRRKPCNARVLLFRLPTDILQEILLDLVLEDHLSRDDAQHSHRGLGDDARLLDSVRYRFGFRSTWQRIMLVCTYLRQLAISYPLLWSFVNLNTNRDWITLSLRRAGSVPLSLSYYQHSGMHNDYRQRNAEGAYRVLLYLLPRACDVHLFLDHAAKIDAIQTVLRAPMPNLRTISYHLRRAQNVPFDRHSTGGRADRLTSISVGGAGFAIAGIVLPALTRLELECSWIVGTPARMVALLAGARGLEEFYWRSSYFEPAPAEVRADVARLRLPELARVVLHGDHGTLAVFVRSLPVARPSARYYVYGDLGSLGRLATDRSRSAKARNRAAMAKAAQWFNEYLDLLGLDSALEAGGTFRYGTSARGPHSEWALSVVRWGDRAFKVFDGVAGLALMFQDLGVVTRVLDRAQAVEISYGQSMSRFLTHASNTRERLPHLARVVVRGRPSHAGIGNVVSWLRRRAQARRQLQVLELRHPRPGLGLWPAMLDGDNPMRGTYREQIDPGIVGAVIETLEDYDSE